MYEEDCYPRGGSKPSLNKTDSHSGKQENLFGKRKATKSRRRQEKKLKLARDVLTCYPKTAETLSFKTIQEGMIILGCIKEIASLTLTVELPGLIFCTLKVNCISEPFTYQLSERLKIDAINEDTELDTLNHIFKRGQFIPARVIQIEFTGSETKVFLSVKPNDVNTNYYHSDFKIGMLIWAAVTEKSDHGYVLDVGVKHVRSILPFKHVEGGKEYVVGEPLWGIVKLATSTNQVTTLTVSALLEDIGMSVQKKMPNVEKILPGMRVSFRAEKNLKDGLEGTIFTDSVAYVNQVHVSEVFTSMEKYVGETLPALVLYVQPTTRFTFLTLRTTRTAHQPKLSVGQILPAQVISRTEKGIFVKLTKQEKGFITRHRIRNSLHLSDFSDLDALIEAKYPEGSTHKCRILDYVFMDNLYVCTFEKHVLDEKIFTVSDLKVGEIVKGTVQEIQQSGITLKIGNLRGFVTNEHLSNVQYSEVFKTKFKKGQTVTGRIWLSRGLSNIKVTLKSGFLDSDVCLSDYQDAQVNAQYPGMVVKITDSGALVKFYNDVQGWLKQAPNSRHHFKQLLYEGQVVSVWVVDKEGTRLTLSLEDPSAPALTQQPQEEKVPVVPRDLTEVKPKTFQKVKVGYVVTGIVSAVDKVGLHVTVGPNKIEGLIPVSHLSSNPSLGPIFLRFYQKGDEINDLLCISSRKEIILSQSERRYFAQEKHEFAKCLKNNCIVRSYFGKAKKTLLSFTCPVRQNIKDIIVKRHENDNKIEFSKYQPVMVKISDCKGSKHYSVGSNRLLDVFTLDFDYSARQLNRYLDDVALIRGKSIERNDPLGPLKPGMRVPCTVANFNQEGCTVTLGNGVSGIASRTNCPENPKLHQTYKGIILWIDFVHKLVEVTLNPDVVNKINATQDGNISAPSGSLIPYQVLSIRKDFVLCVLDFRHHGNGQLAFIPTQLHENDFYPKCSYYQWIAQKTKFKVTLVDKGRIIGFENPFKRRPFQSTNNDRKKSMEEDQVDSDGGLTQENGIDDSDEAMGVDDHQLNEDDDDSHEEGLTDDVLEENSIDDSDHEKEDQVGSDEDGLADTDDDLNENTIELSEDESFEESDVEQINEEQESDVEIVKEVTEAQVSDEHEEDGNNDDHDDSQETQMRDDDNKNDVTDSEEDHSDDPSNKAETDEDEAEEEGQMNNKQKSNGNKNGKTTEEKLGEKSKRGKNMVFENTSPPTLIVGNEDADSPDEDEALGIKTDAIITTKLSKTKSNEKKKRKKKSKKERTGEERSLAKQRNELEEGLYNKSYKIKIAERAVLPGVENFFDSDKEDNVAHSSEDDTVQDDKTVLTKGKKRKLSRREQADLAREQEEYLRNKEEELVNSEGIPQNAEQFDRRLLGEPNSSELWAQYIAFHIQSTEIDKARAVVQRALKTIQQSAVQDRLNIWITYLNLENMYGSKEMFDKVFEEAVRCNDALTIYLEAIKILAESDDVDEKIKKTRGKFKQDARMYIEIGKVYYKQKRLADARRLKDNALRTIVDKKKHVPLIVQFAIMELNDGEENHGEALFETILQSDPRRTDVWGTYVDQLVKKNKIDLARRVLQRAVGQKLNYKKMKVLYKKYQEFEQRYGTSETQSHVKQLLQEYASQFGDV